MKNVSGTAIRWVVAGIVISLLVLGGLAMIQKKKRALAKAPHNHLPATLVDTVKVCVGDLTESHDYLARVEPIQAANITARLTATIEAIAVDEGDSVIPGQTLMKLDRRQIDAQIEAVQAQIRQKQAELQANQSTVASLAESFAYWSREAERDMELVKTEAIPQSVGEATLDKKSEVEGKLSAARQQSAALEQQIKSLDARLEELKTTLSYCEIVSPFAGIVTSRLVDPGDEAAPGKTLVVIESAGAKMIAFDIPQSDLPAVEPGLKVTFKIGEQTRDASITRLYPSLNRARMVRAEVVLDDNQATGLTSGQYLTASVVFNRLSGVCLIPTDALIEGASDKGTRVYVVKDGTLAVREVRVLGTASELAGVQGLEPGEEVVVNSFLGWARLSDGLKVEARP